MTRQNKTFAIGIILVIASIVTIAVFSFLQSRKVDIVSSRINDTRNILLQLNNLYSTIIQHADAARNYSLDGKDEHVQKMRSTAADLLSKIEHLNTLGKERRGGQIATDSLALYISRRTDFSNRLIITGKQNGLAAASNLYQTGKGREYNNAIFSLIQKLQADEFSTLQQDEEKNINSIKQLSYYLTGLLGFTLVLVLILVQKARFDIAHRKKTEEQLKYLNLQLQKQVTDKSTELTGVFDRITDGFIALDKNFCFTYVNKRAGEMTNRHPDSFIGKNILEEFDKNISKQFRNAIHKAMKDQEYIYFEEYSPAYDCWFEDHLYPSPEGVSIFYRDISERKKAEEAIHKSEERYRALIEQASDAIIITDQKGNFLEVNTSFCNKFGYTKDELTGLNIARVIDPEQMKSDPVRFDHLLVGQTIFRERKMVHRNGFIIEVEANVKMLPDGRMLAVARDITERRKIEEEKEKIHYQLNERVKELTTLYKVGQILQTEEKSVEAVLQEIVSILPGAWQYPEVCAAKILLGKSAFKTSNYIDNSIYKQNVRFDFSDTMGLVEVIYLEEKPAEAEGPFLTEERSLINMVAEMLRIYFVRKQAAGVILEEKNLSDSVINSLPGIFYFYDRSGKFLRWNKRFGAVTNYSNDEIANMHPLDFFEGEDKTVIQKCIDDIFKTGGSASEAFIITRDKQKIPYYFTGTSVEIMGVLYALGIGMDITERKKAEEELRLSGESLEKSYEEIRLLASHIENIREEEKIKIAREIHDELGQQLTGLKMDVAWLSKKFGQEQTMLQQKAKDILLLLDEMVRSVRRIASELRPGLLDDLGLVAAIEWQSEEFEKRSGIKTRFRSSVNDELIPSRYLTGFFRIYQESLTNVARHAGAKEVVATLEKTGDEIVLQVNDDGVGFDSKEIANKKTLGLLGMKERTMMMGGRYKIVSNPGKGTTVIVAVPLDQNNIHKN